MQFFVYFTMTPNPDSRPGPKSPPSADRMAEIARFHQDAMASGVIVATGRLGQTVTRVRRDGDALAITDGPFMEGKELIPGFTIIDLPTREEAVDWVAAYRDMMGMPELRMSPIST